MSWLNHPKPVGLDLATPVIDLPVLPDGGVGEARFAVLQFEVRYALLEYVSFMWQHGRYVIRRRRIGRIGSAFMLATSTARAALNFIMQGRSRRTYEFTIDGDGIVRCSRGGVSLISWSDVRAIRSYSRGFMIMLRQGTLPIPFRCLNGEQTSALGAYAASLK